MTEFIARRLRSGQTLRYHTTPHIGNGQTVAEHAWRATVLLHTLWPEYATQNAILFMLYHDSAEQELGDLPAPTKWKNERLHEEYDHLERHHMSHKLEINFDLTANETQCCKMADMLELVDHTAHRIMRGDHSFEARDIYWNGRKHLINTYSSRVLFGPARTFMAHLHAQVVQVCPAANAHIS
jgi:hypothetical protein